MLSEAQEKIIIEEIEQSSVKSRELKDDLIDHFCCLVEIEMNKGKTFQSALQSAYKQTAPNGLNEIQNETLFLLNYNKIMLMKRLTYASGYLFTLALIVGIFFKLMHLPGATVLMFGGGSGFAFIFIPLLLINKFKRSAPKVMSEKLKWILGATSLIMFMLASWMKLQHLMGAAFMLGLSFLVFGFGFLPFLFFRMYKKSVEEV